MSVEFVPCARGTECCRDGSNGSIFIAWEEFVCVGIFLGVRWCPHVLGALAALGDTASNSSAAGTICLRYEFSFKFQNWVMKFTE